jgi:orotate phosphoribosyltransferase
MSNPSLAKKIYETCNIKGRFLLRSGKYSDEYFDKYQLECRPELLESIAAEMVGSIPKDTELLAGLEMGGIPVATALSLKTRIPVIFVRKKAKEYGTCKIAEGMDFKGKRVTVIEDVVTSGGAIIDGVKALREQGALVENVLCVIDREAGGPEKLKENNLKLSPLFTASQLREAAGVVAKA